MKLKFLFASSVIAALMTSMTSCGSEDGPGAGGDDDEEGTAITCIEQIIDGCVDISGEVGDTKIGDPMSKWLAGNTEEALYSVESWYSFHSREDYHNNILSIRNSYYGTLDGTVSDKSISALVAKNNPDLDAKMKNAIQAAGDAILAIPQPFRNNINSPEAATAQTKCGELTDALKDLKGYFQRTPAISTNEVLSPIVANYVDAIVIPTYRSLKEENEALRDAVIKFYDERTDANFAAAAAQWLKARQPWETSEAFLFGPVANLGLDPNMDSWPLDIAEVSNILTSGNYDDLDWTGKYDEENENIAQAQGVRGYHTLEFLLFYNGNPRTTHDTAVDDTAHDIIYTDANKDSWCNYMRAVVLRLVDDSNTLYDQWTVKADDYTKSYADVFKSFNI